MSSSSSIISKGNSINGPIEPSTLITTKAIPKLDNAAGYGVWRPLMEHHLMERKLNDVLKMKIDNWRFISDLVDQYTNKANEVLFKKFGVTWREPVKTPQIKTEKVDESLMNLDKLSNDELKQLNPISSACENCLFNII